MKKSLIGALAALPLLGAATSALADEDVSVSVGLRAWSMNWNGNRIVTLAGGGNAIARLDSGLDSHTSVLPILVGSIRYKNFGLSASHAVDTKFDFTAAGENVGSIKRKESDVHGSYYFMPGLAAGVGYKQLEWGSGNTKIRGPIASLSGTAGMGSNIGLYGTAAAGRLKAHVDGSSANAAYTLGEFGIAYSFITPTTALKGLSATLGYRIQSIRVKNAPYFAGLSYTDTTYGPTLGIVGQF